MGLDCWVAPYPQGAGEVPAAAAAELRRLDLPLCEWTAHGGFVHFAGKRYLGLVEAAAGVWLSEPWLPPETLAAMAQRLAAQSPATAVAAFNAEHYADALAPLTTDEYTALRVLFAACAAAGLGLANDW